MYIHNTCEILYTSPAIRCRLTDGVSVSVAAVSAASCLSACCTVSVVLLLSVLVMLPLPLPAVLSFCVGVSGGPNRLFARGGRNEWTVTELLEADGCTELDGDTMEEDLASLRDGCVGCCC